LAQAIVFDFDGVIANSEPLHFAALRDTVAAEGVELGEADYYARYLGYDDVGSLVAIAADRELSWDDAAIAALVERKAQRMEQLERERSILFPGAADTITRLSARCPLAIASGALRAEILRIVEREALAQYFVAIVGADDTAASKPAPDPYRRAVELLASRTGRGITSAGCVAIEDSRWGLESARAAGLKTIAVAHTYPAEALAMADLVVRTVGDVTWDQVCSLVAADDGR
jgi:beta-phosphoglucomutase